MPPLRGTLDPDGRACDSLRNSPPGGEADRAARQGADLGRRPRVDELQLRFGLPREVDLTPGCCSRAELVDGRSRLYWEFVDVGVGGYGPAGTPNAALTPDFEQPLEVDVLDFVLRPARRAAPGPTLLSVYFTPPRSRYVSDADFAGSADRWGTSSP